MEAEPGARVSMPLDIEAVAAYPVQASERGIEFFTQGLRLTGSITLDEPIAVPMPFAEDIDWVVELSGAAIDRSIVRSRTGRRCDGPPRGPAARLPPGLCLALCDGHSRPHPP